MAGEGNVARAKLEEEGGMLARKRRGEFEVKRSPTNDRLSQVLDGAPTDVPPSDPRDSWRSEARPICDGVHTIIATHNAR